MANKFQKGHVFVPGEIVDPDDLNNLVDLALALPPLITDQTSVNATTGDKVLVSRGGVLKQADVSTFPSGVTSVNFNATPATVFNDSVTGGTGTAVISLELADQSPNKFLAGPVSGSAATPAFRELAPADLPSATVSVAAGVINWSLGNCFSKSLTASLGMTFSNPTEGQTIVLLVANTGAFNVTFPVGVDGVYWAGATVYAATHGAGRHDIVIFRYINGHYWGNYYLNFISV